MRAHYLQHVPFEGLGSIETWLKSKGYSISSTNLYADEKLPEINDIDLLIIMGGPMSVNDEKKFPWLVNEKKFVRDYIKSGKAVLGVCLGAQLMASAMGSRVFRNHEKEIGWFPVRGLKQTNASNFQFPELFTVFHWHGETFDLPANSALLASSEACVNQAFQIGKAAIGLQFHLETTAETAQKMVASCGDELVKAKYIQTESEILAADNETYMYINKLMSDVLSYITGR